MSSTDRVIRDIPIDERMSMIAAIDGARSDPLYADWRRLRGLPPVGSGLLATFDPQELFRCSYPEDAFGIRTMLACRIFEYWEADAQWASFWGVNSKHLPLAIGSTIAESAPFVWSQETFEAASSLRDSLPRHVIGPVPEMLWIFPTTLVDLDDPDPARDRVIAAQFISMGSHGFGICLIKFGAMLATARPSSGEYTFEAGTKPTWKLEMIPFLHGWRYPEDIPEDAHRAAGLWLGLLAFINSPYIPKDERRIGRRLVKAYGRFGGSRHSTRAVTFIDLRTAVKEKPQSQGLPHEHRVRWLVRGHVRAQWYAKDKSHRLIWIAPYIKGPKGAPLRQSVYRVIH